MKLNEWQLLALVVGAFAAVIAVDVMLQYRNNAEWAAGFPKLPTAMFGKSRAGEMVSQEMNVPAIRSIPTVEEPVEDQSEG